MSRRSRRGAPVVIMRKQKRLFRTGHLAAFALTGGLSSVYTAAKASTNAGYNARTRSLAAAADQGGDDAGALADRYLAERGIDPDAPCGAPMLHQRRLCACVPGH